MTRAWHVSPRRNRESIEARGLLLSETASHYVWIFADFADALRAQGQRWGGCPWPDLYEVDVDGLTLLPDPHPGWPGIVSLVTDQPIPRERVTRVVSCSQQALA